MTACDFLGETFEPPMLNFFEDARKFLSDIDGDVHQKLFRAPRADDLERWRCEMPAAHQVVFEAVAGESLRAMRYPCMFSGREATSIEETMVASDEGYSAQ